jgi:hypothetical protein
VAFGSTSIHLPVCIGASTGVLDGALDGVLDGALVGVRDVGDFSVGVGTGGGTRIGDATGLFTGTTGAFTGAVGILMGEITGTAIGDVNGTSVGDCVGFIVGPLSPPNRSAQNVNKAFHSLENSTIIG